MVARGKVPVLILDRRWGKGGDYWWYVCLATIRTLSRTCGEEVTHFLHKRYDKMHNQLEDSGKEVSVCGCPLTKKRWDCSGEASGKVTFVMHCFFTQEDLDYMTVKDSMLLRVRRRCTVAVGLVDEGGGIRHQLLDQLQVKIGEKQGWECWSYMWNWTVIFLYIYST